MTNSRLLLLLLMLRHSQYPVRFFVVSEERVTPVEGEEWYSVLPTCINDITICITHFVQ